MEIEPFFKSERKGVDFASAIQVRCEISHAIRSIRKGQSTRYTGYSAVSECTRAESPGIQPSIDACYFFFFIPRNALTRNTEEMTIIRTPQIAFTSRPADLV